MPSRPIIVGEPDPVFRALTSPRTWALALLGGLLGALLGGAWLLQTPKTFKATIAIELTEASPQVNLSGIGPKARPVTIDTDAQIVSSDAVVAAVAEQTAGNPEGVREHLVVSARPLTQVMTITYAAGSAESALRGATAAGNAFLSERERLVIDPVKSYLRSVGEQNVSEAGLSGQGTTYESKANLWSLELRRQAALTRELGLQGPGRILEESRITAAGERGDLEVPVATGASLGALGGVAASVVWRHRLSRQRSGRRSRRAT